MKDDCRPRGAHRLWAYSVQYTCGRIRIDYTNGKGTVSVYERVTVRASWRAGRARGRSSGRAGVGSIHDSPVEDACPVLSTVGTWRIRNYAYYYYISASGPNRRRCLALTLFRLVLAPDGYTREIPTGTRSCPRYLGAAVSLGGSWRRRASGMVTVIITNGPSSSPFHQRRASRHQRTSHPILTHGEPAGRLHP